MIISHRTARLSHILHTASVGALNVIPEREKCVRSQSHICVLVQPCTLLLSSKHCRFYLEDILPCTVSQHIHIILAHVQINGIVAVCTLDTVNKLKSQHLRRLAQPPVVSLRACKTGTVNSGLLSCSDTDGLSTLHVAYGIGLCIL